MPPVNCKHGIWNGSYCYQCEREERDAYEERIAELEAQIARLTMKPETVKSLHYMMRRRYVGLPPLSMGHDEVSAAIDELDRYAAAIGGTDGK